MTWTFNSEIITEAPKGYEGFVYKITHIESGRAYIGKKSFKSRRKQKKTGRKKTLESDWQDYYGSSDELKKDIEIYGKESFHREILYICQHKKSMSYYEVLEQFLHDVIGKDGFYNNNIAGKFFTSEKDRIYSKVLKKEETK